MKPHLDLCDSPNKDVLSRGEKSLIQRKECASDSLLLVNVISYTWQILDFTRSENLVLMFEKSSVKELNKKVGVKWGTEKNGAGTERCLRESFL